MTGNNLTKKEKQLALSTLVRRNKHDPGAVDLLVQLMFDPSDIIRKRTVAIADRFIEQERTVKALLRVATTSSEDQDIRKRSMDQLEVLFDPHREPDLSKLSSGCIPEIQSRILSILHSSDEPLSLRGNALELASWFVRDELLREWILYFHSQQGHFGKISAIAAMGRSEESRWRPYIQGYLNGENMELICAALEAIAQHEGKSETSAGDSDTTTPLSSSMMH